MDMKDCECVPGTKCMNMPNRFRKILKEKMHWEYEGVFTWSMAYRSGVECDDAIALEFGNGYSHTWCQSMMPKIVDYVVPIFNYDMRRSDMIMYLNSMAENISNLRREKMKESI